MNLETCPLLSELSWLSHGFYGRDSGMTNKTIGLHTFDRYNDVLFLPQNHGDNIAFPDQNLPETGADASINLKGSIALAIKTADCVPLLLACTKTKMIAAVHAGWPGALNCIAQKTVKMMQDHGADPAHIIGAIGPCIHDVTYPVGAELRDRFIAENNANGDFFKPFEDRFCLDVPGIVAKQLRDVGVNQVWQSPTNTFTSAAHFSYRNRDKDPASDTGRNVSIIARIN